LQRRQRDARKLRGKRSTEREKDGAYQERRNERNGERKRASRKTTRERSDEVEKRIGAMRDKIGRIKEIY
jgi:hypothetical protein